MKKALFAILTICAATHSSAQESPVSLRLAFGGTFSSLTVSGSDKEPKTGIGFGVGLEADRRLGQQTSLTLGLSYTINQLELDEMTFGFTDSNLSTPSHLTGSALSFAETTDMSIKMEYVGLPLLMNYRPWKGLTLKAGIEPRLLLSSSMEYRLKSYEEQVPFTKANIVSGQVTPYESYRTDGSKKRFNNFDLSMPLGISYECGNIVFEWRYHFGLTNISKDKDKVRLGYSLLTLAYRLQQ